MPLHLDRPGGGAGLLFALRHDADDIAFADDGDDARHLSRGVVVQRAQLRAATGRADHRSPQHARKTDVRDERRAAGDDVAGFEPGHRLTRVAPARVGHKRQLVGYGPGERRTVQKLDVRDPPVATVDDRAAVGVEPVDRYAKLRAGALEQLPARERRGIA